MMGDRFEDFGGGAPVVEPLPYCPDSAVLFEAVAGRPWAVFLDSGHPLCTQGRYDILSADPVITLVTRGGMTEVRYGDDADRSPEDPFALLRHCLGPASQVDRPRVPFAGGAIGYFAYDLARRLERLPSIAEDDEGLPQMAVGIYDWAVVVDHEERRAWLAAQGRDPATQKRWAELKALFSAPAPDKAPSPFAVRGPVRAETDRDGYGAAFKRIQTYIRDGDCYQVNFAQRFSVPVEGDPWPAYRVLRGMNPAPFSAYLNTPYAQILSSSPERFLRVRDRRVETRPIKGTRPRAADPAKDRALAQALGVSPKDRAENLMIVDLLRNDLGKSCAVGSVAVPELFKVESFATVHHLVSTVTGELADGKDALDVLRGCFPGGSITGAPKLRAMAIIEELEPYRRGVYCGAVGYVGFDGAMDTNIAIRTLVHADGVLRFWAGGGIVADSDRESEYRETFHKAAAMLRFLGPEGEALLAGLSGEAMSGEEAERAE